MEPAGSSRSTTMSLPRFAASRGLVPSPATCPRSSRSRPSASRRKVQNLMLEEPAFRTTIASPPGLT